VSLKRAGKKLHAVWLCVRTHSVRTCVFAECGFLRERQRNSAHHLWASARYYSYLKETRRLQLAPHRRQQPAKAKAAAEKFANIKSWGAPCFSGRASEIYAAAADVLFWFAPRH
jgi:hypothetical protein